FRVTTDGFGNVQDRPLTRGLPCFADPVEYWRGISDEPYRRITSKGFEEVAWNCGGCHLRAACGTVVLERITTSPGLAKLRDSWEGATATLTAQERYRHSTWAV